MKKFLKVLFLMLSFGFLIYLALPTPNYPNKLSDALQSNEPGDTEDPLRKAYFTDLQREDVMAYYVDEFKKFSRFNVVLPTYRLNYPPEDAQTLIRDQTRSTFLEEIVHPFRESFFVNGFKPKEEKDNILIAGKEWVEKITVKYVPSNVYLRLFVGIFSLLFIKILFREWQDAIVEFRKVFKKIWIFR